MSVRWDHDVYAMNSINVSVMRQFVDLLRQSAYRADGDSVNETVDINCRESALTRSSILDRVLEQSTVKSGYMISR